MIILFVIYEYYSGFTNNNRETEAQIETQAETSEYYEQGKEKSSELISEMEDIDWEENYDKA